MEAPEDEGPQSLEQYPSVRTGTQMWTTEGMLSGSRGRPGHSSPVWLNVEDPMVTLHCQG